MESRLFSIIIPVYNREDLIAETLDSLLNQTYPYWECIVVDDRSSDRTASIVRDYAAKDDRFRYFEKPAPLPKGPNSCRNYGYAESLGEWIKWLDSDDLLVGDALQKINAAITNDSEAVVSRLQFVDSKKNKIDRVHGFFSDDLIQEYLEGKIAYYTPGPTWRRDFLERQAVLFDEELRNLDDWDFNLRMLYQKPNVELLDESLVLYRVHENSLSHEVGKFNMAEIRSECRAREKHLKLIADNKQADVKQLRRFMASRYRFLLRGAMFGKQPGKLFFLRNLLRHELAVSNYPAVFKALAATVSFALVGKGYKLLSK